MEIYSHSGTRLNVVEADEFQQLMMTNMDSVFECYLLAKFNICSDELKEIIKKHYPEKFI